MTNQSVKRRAGSAVLLGTALERLKTEFIAAMLPKWASTAYDAQHGQFMECLQLDGTPDVSNIVRTRTAARLIYVYAHASALGVAPHGSLQMAEQAFANLHQMAWMDGEKPGYVRRFDRATGVVTDPVRDLYDNACVLLALSWLLSATGKSQYRNHIDATISAVDQTLKDPFGGWAEDDLGTLPRRQNPHMHYLEAHLALCESHPSAEYMQRESSIFRLFQTRFLAGEHGLLYENFGPKWEVSDLYQSGRFEPGHMCEWVWLVHRHVALTHKNQNHLCSDLLHKALAIGRSQGTLFLIDQASKDGVPLSRSRRLWSQVEMLKAFLSQHQNLGDEHSLRNAEAVASAMFDTYFQAAPHGCWHDMLDLENRSIGKTIPASSLYHLWTAVADLLP